MAMVLVSHDLGVVAGRADEIIVMYAGQASPRAPTRRLFRADEDAVHGGASRIHAPHARSESPEDGRATSVRPQNRWLRRPRVAASPPPLPTTRRTNA